MKRETTKSETRKRETEQPEESSWQCFKCGKTLKTGKVVVSYMGNDFPVDLLKCPKCGLVLVTEQLALGQMNEVEQVLEDK